MTVFKFHYRVRCFSASQAPVSFPREGSGGERTGLPVKYQSECRSEVCRPGGTVTWFGLDDRMGCGRFLPELDGNAPVLVLVARFCPSSQLVTVAVLAQFSNRANEAPEYVLTSFRDVTVIFRMICPGGANTCP